MSESFQGKAVLVTGSGSGIGRASALLFAKRGAKLVVNDVVAERGEETMQLIQKAGGEALFVEADMSKEADVKMIVDKTVQTYGRLDCAHNNVGDGGGGPLIEATEEMWYKTMDVTLKSVWLCMKHEIPHMIKQGSGAIVNMCSIFGMRGAPGGAFYSTAKHGVIGLTRSAALEYAKAGIRINSVCPIGVQGTFAYQRQLERDPEFVRMTIEQSPMGRDATMEEVAETIVWLCSDAASFITAHVMVVDGGYTAQFGVPRKAK